MRKSGEWGKTKCLYNEDITQFMDDPFIFAPIDRSETTHALRSSLTIYHFLELLVQLMMEHK